MIEIFRDTKYDFLGKKWLFIGLSWMLILAGAVSVACRALDGNPNTHPFNLGVDFAGGTIVDVKFREKPDTKAIRTAIEREGIEGSEITIQPVSDEIGQAPKNEVLIRLPNLLHVEPQNGRSDKAATDADIGGQIIRAALASLNDKDVARDKIDLNMANRQQLREELVRLDPLNLRAGGATQSADARYSEIANRITDYREKDRGGLIGSVDEIKNLSGIEPQLGPALTQRFFAGAAAIKSTDAVSPQVGADLRSRAAYITLLACAGMLLFVAFRFQSWGFGVGAVVAVLHDLLVTLGIFSIMQWEINVTVMAALLTLVGYSMNDTIVIFDRIRELRHIRRREKLEVVTNEAINQTLSRTIITSGLTFLAVIALLLFGGEVLRSFSWALCIGITVGTYSSVYIASPFMLWWEGDKARPRFTFSEAPGTTSILNPVAILKADGLASSDSTPKIVTTSSQTAMGPASAGWSKKRKKNRKNKTIH
jgi:preprotein translocase subunit SecF